MSQANTPSILAMFFGETNDGRCAHAASESRSDVSYLAGGAVTSNVIGVLGTVTKVFGRSLDSGFL